MKKALLTTVSVLSAALLAGCGGGGGDEAVVVTPATTAEGVYGGTFTKPASTSDGFRMLVLDGGQFWMLYGEEDPAGFIVEGLIQGNGTSSTVAGVSTFTSPSTSARDFGDTPIANAVLSSNYTVSGGSKSISGTVTTSGTINFSSAAFTGSGTYNYNDAALLTTVAGNWTVTGLAAETYTLAVNGTDGTFTATPAVAGCSFTGTLTPRSSGKNVFNVSLTTGGAPCVVQNELSTGVALAYSLGGGVTQLVLGVVNAGRTGSAVVFGTKP